MLINEASLTPDSDIFLPHHSSQLDPSGNKEVKKDLDKCKEMINLNMQKDVEYDKMSREERESLVGPERLSSLHLALKEIGVSIPNFVISIAFVRILLTFTTIIANFLFTES